MFYCAMSIKMAAGSTPVSGSGSQGLDLGEKYKRLAVDYAKIKSQLGVLKKKYLEEQEVKKAIEDKVREKDLALRKSIRENEALDLRNTQLTRRVLALQEDLNSSRKNIKDREKMRSVDPNTQEALEAQATELAKKLKENEQLRTAVDDIRTSSERTLQDLRSQLEQRDLAASRAEGLLSTIEEQHEKQIQELHTINAVLQGKYDKMATEAKALRAKLDERPMRSVDPTHTTSIAVVPPQLPNGPPVPGFSPHQGQEPDQPSLLEGVTCVSSHLGQLCSHLTNYHSYLEQRLFQHANVQDAQLLSPGNRMFLALLKQSKSKTRPVEAAFTRFVDQLTVEFSQQDLEEFCTTWSDLVVFVERLTPLHQLSLQEESAQPSCGQKLSDRNNFLSSALPSVPSALAVLRDYLYLLTQSPPHHNEPALCDHLCRVVRIIHISVKGLMAAFSAKVTLEYQMPTISAKLKTTNECILSSLNGLCGVMDQLSSFVDVHGSALPSVRQAVKARSSEVDDEKTKNKSSADGGDILISLATSSEAIAEVTQVKNALERTLEEAQKRVITLEEEKEKLLVEFQLLKMKFERDQKPTSSRPGSGRSREEVDTSNLKEEEASVSEGELVQKHFAGRVAELSSQVQQSDSKVTFLDAECQSLQKQLVSCWKAKARLELDLEESSIMVSRLEDEIKTLSSNYENQISVMSDHLCSLNEQLMNKHEEPQPQRTAKQKKRKN